MTEPKPKTGSGLSGFLEAVAKAEEAHEAEEPSQRYTSAHLRTTTSRAPVHPNGEWSTDIWACRDCGCLVLDQQAHDMFHSRIEPIGPLGAMHR